MKYKLLLVEWLDSTSRNEWNAVDEIVADVRVPKCRSVGWLLHEVDTHVYLASSLFAYDDPTLRSLASGDIKIPKGCILKRTVLATHDMEIEAKR